MSQLNLTLRDTNVEIDDAVVAHRARESTGVTLPGTPCLLYTSPSPRD